MVRHRRALLPLALASLALPAAAHAQGRIRYLSPAHGARVGHALTFRAKAPAGAVVRVSGSPRTDARGLLADDDAQDLPTRDGTARTTSRSLLARRPGPYWWQAYVPGGGPVGAVQRLTVHAPHGRHGRLYPTFGPRGHASFYLSSAGFPDTVDGRRFRTIVRAAAARWHLRARRWTSAPAGRRDGWNVAGFSTLPRGVLGLETDYTVGGRVVEQDVQFDASAPWSDGPGYPDFDHIDLESVVIHELGHMAGVERHRAHCANSPMVAGLASGEWWRGPDDHWSFGCAAAGAASTGWRVERRVIPLG